VHCVGDAVRVLATGRLRLVAMLPVADTHELFQAVRKDEAALRPGVEQLCRLLGLKDVSLSRFAAGTRPVYAAGDLVLKLYPPVSLVSCRVEAGVLAAVDGRLPILTPRVRAAGEHDGWGYVLMSRQPGVPLDTVWKQITTKERDHIAGCLGETIAVLHQVPPPLVENWLPDGWPAFVARQRARCAERQRRLGLPPAWVDQFPGFLDEVALRSGPPVLLHTEVRRQHLLAAQAHGGAWRLSGLIDFDHAMRGAREYELAAAGLYVALGDSRFLRQVLTASGYASAQLDHDLRERLLAWAILHKYSNLAAWLRRLPEPSSPTLASLADRWFATE
jgi:hygromycin-B 7''-O-kinase